MTDMDAVVKEIREIEEHDRRQHAMDWPDARQVFGNPEKPDTWRQVVRVREGVVYFYMFGASPQRMDQPQWSNWVHSPDVENITASIQSSR